MSKTLMILFPKKAPDTKQVCYRGGCPLFTGEKMDGLCNVLWKTPPESMKDKLACMCNFYDTMHPTIVEADGVDIQEVIKRVKGNYEPQGLDEAIQLVNEYNLRPYRDGNAWCILLGKDIQSGICGFGNTLSEAYLDFLKSYKEYPHPINELLTNCQPNDGLEEAAKESAYSVIPTFPEGDIKAHIHGFKAGAKWKEEQLPKWKKTSYNPDIAMIDENRNLYYKGNKIPLVELEKLPGFVQIRKKEE